MTDHADQKDSSKQGAAATPPADSTIPASPTGVAAGYTGDASSFEPEEDDAGSDDEDDDDDADTPDTDAASVGGTGPRATKATELSGEDRSIFQSHWDEFAGHID